jgi:hypothetical protein
VTVNAPILAALSIEVWVLKFSLILSPLEMTGEMKSKHRTAIIRIVRFGALAGVAFLIRSLFRGSP